MEADTFVKYSRKRRNRYSDWLQAGRPRGRSLSPDRGKIFLFSTLLKPILGPVHSPIQLVPGAIYPWVKRPGNESNHPPLTSAKVKNMWIYTSTPPTSSWHSAQFVKHRDNFNYIPECDLVTTKCAHTENRK
jgi:hypothetical protein